MKTVIDVFPTNEKNLEIINYSCCLFLACCSCQIHHSFSSLVDVYITTCTVKSYDRIPCDVEFILCSLSILSLFSKQGQGTGKEETAETGIRGKEEESFGTTSEGKLLHTLTASCSSKVASTGCVFS